MQRLSGIDDEKCAIAKGDTEGRESMAALCRADRTLRWTTSCQLDGNYAICSISTFSRTTGLRGLSVRSRSTSEILSTMFWPSITSPKMV